MKRYIAILTLALTAALSANQAFALDPGNCTSALRDADDLELLVAFVAYEYGTEAAYELLLELGIDPGDCSSALRTGVLDSDSFSVKMYIPIGEW